MKTKKASFLLPPLLALLILAAPGVPEEAVKKSRWAASPVVIDGIEEEWSGEKLFSENKAGVDYFLRNDAENLYLLFIIRGQDFLSTLESTGITLYFNTEGRKKKDRGLHFIKRKVTADEIIRAMEQEGRLPSEELKADLKSKSNIFLYDYEIIRKKKSTAEETRTDGESKPPAFKYTKKAEETIFEFRIPLSQDGQPGGIGVLPGGSFKIGFEWGGLTDQMKAARMARIAGASERGAEGDTKSESHARNRGGSIPGVSPSGGTSKKAPKVYSFWVDVKLASNQE